MGASKTYYRAHKYSGPRSRRKAVRAQLTRLYGPNVTREQVWRKKPTPDLPIPRLKCLLSCLFVTCNPPEKDAFSTEESNSETGTLDCQVRAAECRYCHSTDCSKDIFTEYIWMDQKEVYREMLSETFNIEISILKSEEDINVSGLICDLCILILRNATEFKKKVLQSEQTINKYLEIATPTDDFDGTLQFENGCADFEMKPNIEISNDEVKQENETAFVSYDDETNVQGNVKHDGNNGNDKAEGLQESCADGDAEAMRNDSLLSKRPVVVLTRIESKINSDEEYLNKNVRDLNKKKVGPFICDICQKHFQKKKNLKLHIAIHMDKQLDLNVRKVYPLSSNRRNKLSHTKEKRFECDVRNMYFSQLGTLKRRTLIHTGEKPYQCDVCNKSFRYNHVLKSHMLLHTREKTYQCDVCKMCFDRIDYLKVHILTHNPKKPHQCDVCNKYFRSRCNLEKHILIHSGEKSYQCEVCKQNFKLLSYLKFHTLTHTRATISM